MIKQPAQSTVIQNTETQIPENQQMNDRDYLNDLLMAEKYMTTSYVQVLHEASHQALYEDIKNIFNATCDHQRDLYNLMFNKGWYKVQSEEPRKLQQTHQQFSQYAQQQFPK
ncbi:spore coat protein [Sporolactobacillus sp. THM7-4]|nr:spore coat protein [Sporolactobacillus sp. THM7-4]